MNDIYISWRNFLKPNQKKRTYQHFDSPIDLEKESHFQGVISVLENLKAHEFLPFTKFYKSEIRYRRDQNKKTIRSLKKRPIMYASHLDAHVYSFYTYKWFKKYDDFLSENNISSNVIAYRRILDESTPNKGHGKSNIQFAREVFQHIQEVGTCSVIIADISNFFDKIKHNKLKDHLCRILEVSKLSDDEFKVLKSLTNFRYVLNEKGSRFANLMFKIKKKMQTGRYSRAKAVYESGRNSIKENKSEYGIPQGSPVSGLLSNIYLAPFDCEILQNLPNVFYRRYSDDIILVCPPGAENESFSFLKQNVEKYGLSINPSKAFIARLDKDEDGCTVCVEVLDGEGKKRGERKYIDYLGFEFNGGKVFLRKGTLQRTHKKNNKRIKKYYARQTSANPRKSHSHRGKVGTGSYINNASKVMKEVGSGVESQQKRMNKSLRRARKNAKGGLSKAK